ncbi:MAG: MaoC family dehydratase [Acidimicrobiales bacterium]
MAPTIGTGRYFEDFALGDVYRHPLGRTINDADNTWFTLLTMNTNQSHFNHHYAAGTEFGRPIVNSGLTVAILLGITVSDISQNAIANLGWDDIRLTHPVFAGDTLYGESLVLALRQSRSRPHAGIVTVKSRGLNQDGVECLSWRRTVMVLKRSAPAAHGSFPEPQAAIDAAAH